MNLLQELEKLPPDAERIVHSIAAEAGVTITDAEDAAAGVVSAPMMYLVAHWQTITISLAIGIVIGSVAGGWA